MRRFGRLALTASLTAAPALGQTGRSADLIVTGATIHTADPARPLGEAVAIRDGRFVFVGSAREASWLAGPSTRVIDARGTTIVPGMIDAHAHLAAFAERLRQVDLSGARSYEEVVRRVAERAQARPPGEWVLGHGWDQNLWPTTGFPTHSALSRAIPDHPVLLTRIDSHAILVNARAMELSRLGAGTADPDGGRIVRNAEGEPTGVLVDRAMELVRRDVAAASPDQLRQGLRLAQRELHRVGLTGLHDAGVSRAVIEVYEDLARAGELTIRNYVMVRGPGADLDHYLAMGPRVNVDGDHRLSVRAIKLVADGALGSRGAALLEPYSDDPSHSGLLLLDTHQVRDVALAALDRGFQLNVHAIGDRANRTVLDAFEAAFATRPIPDHRFRVEHASMIHYQDIPRLAELGLLASVQAVFVASDSPWAEKRVGWTRMQGTYAWRSLRSTGVVLPGGTDVPVEPPSPIRSFHAAITRQDGDGWPAGGWVPAQRLTREEALYHITLWPAFAAFQEQLVGSITPGKLADLVILSQDIMTAAPQDILETRVETTIVGGSIVFEAAGARP